MFPTFFKHKMREVGSFLEIVAGKLKGDPELRQKGVDDALDAMADEKKVYLNEKAEAKKNVTSDKVIDRTPKKIDKPIRESNQDISAI